MHLPAARALAPCISLQLGTLSARALGAACGGPRTLRLSAEEAHDRVVDMDVIALALLLEDVDGTHGWAKNVEAGLELQLAARGAARELEEEVRAEVPRTPGRQRQGSGLGRG